MSKGFEGWIEISPAVSGWNGTDAYGATRGNFVYADDETLQINRDTKDQSAKIVNGRVLKASTRITGKQAPGGGLTFQFRSDDLPPLCMAHFQKFSGTAFGGAGSLTGSAQFAFYPEKGAPSFGGSAFGTGAYTAAKGNIFTVNILKKFFDTTDNGGKNTHWFKNCLVDQLEFTCEANSDAKVKANVFAHDVGTLALDSTFNPPGTLGSYSVNSSYQAWNATLSFAGGTLDVTKLAWTSANGMQEYLSIGSINPSRYRWGRYKISGSLDLDFPYDGMKYFGSSAAESDLALTATFYNGTSDWVSFSFPKCRLNPVEANMKGGDQETTFTLPFEAYESEDGSTAPVVVTIHTTGFGSVPWVRNPA